MKLTRVFKVKNDLVLINRLLDEIQGADDDNRVVNVQVVDKTAWVTARVEVDPLI